MKIATVTASGVSQLDPARFSADGIDIADVEASMANEEHVRITFKVPRIAVSAYSGPAAVQRLPASPSLAELYRFGFEQLASVTAASIAAPSLTETLTVDAKPQDGAIRGDYIYSGLVIEGIKDGKIASIKADGFHLKFDLPDGPAKQLTGDVANIVANDIDVGALAAVFDPSNANDDHYRSIYQRMSAGPSMFTLPEVLNMRIDSMAVDDFRLNPARVQRPKPLAAMPLARAAPRTPAQEREMMEEVANSYEGIRAENVEMHGLSVETPQDPLKLQAMRFNFANGKIGDFAFEGLEGRSSTGFYKLGRFALKSLDIANLMRVTAQYPEGKPSTEQALALLSLIEGVEIKAFTARDKQGQHTDIDILSLDWGQFVGPIPSKMHLIAKVSAQLNAADVSQKKLVAAGIDKITIDADLGAAWTEASRSFALEPVKLDLGGLSNMTARLSLANVPREVFSTDAVQAMIAATQIEVGVIELTVRDLGALDLAIADYAGVQNIKREAARQEIIQIIRDAGTTEALKPAADALVNFIDTPGQALVIKLTPLAKVPALQLLQLLKSEPLLALAQFRVEVSAGL